MFQKLLERFKSAKDEDYLFDCTNNKNEYKKQLIDTKCTEENRVLLCKQQQRQQVERKHLMQVFSGRRKKKPIAFDAGSSSSCYAMSNSANGQKLKENVFCNSKKKFTFQKATIIPRQSSCSSGSSKCYSATYTLVERQAITLSTAIRQTILSLLPLQVTANETATTTTTTTRATTNTNLVTGTGSSDDGNNHFSSILPLSLGHFLKLTLTFCQWTIAFTTLLLFIVCLTNLIVSVSAQQQQQHTRSNNGAKTELSSQQQQQQIIELNYYNHHRNHHHHHLGSPAARLRSASAISSSPSAITRQQIDYHHHHHQEEKEEEENLEEAPSLLSPSSIGIKSSADNKQHYYSSLDTNANNGNNKRQRRRPIETTVNKKQQKQSSLLEQQQQQSNARLVSSKSPMETAAAATATTTAMNFKERQQTPSLPAELSFRRSSATIVLADSQWIPIVSALASEERGDNNKHVSQSSSSSSSSLLQNSNHQSAESALLDYQPALFSPSSTFSTTHNTHDGQTNIPLSSSSSSQLDQLKQHQNSNQNRPKPQATRLKSSNTRQRPLANAATTLSQEPMHSIASHHHHSHQYYGPPPPPHYHQLGNQHWNHHYNKHQDIPHHHHNHNQNHHHHHHHHYSHQHRRPRLNNNYHHHQSVPPSLDNEINTMLPGKMYTRVLLCDKTLVSLDYVKNLDSEPRPFGDHSNSHKEPNPPSSSSSSPRPLSDDGIIDEVLNDIGDNLIDLDGHYSTLSSSFAGVNNSSLASFGTRLPLVDSGERLHQFARNGNELQQNLNVSLIQNNGNNILNSTSSSNALASLAEQMSNSASVLERRSGGFGGRNLLNDEDPLVRCDMWDLEKGLKSRKPPEHLLKVAIKADFDTVRDAINRCRQLSEKTLPPDDEYRDGLEIMSTEDLISLFSMKRGLIPGTKWCGLGDQANSYNDLGPKHRIDICCRAHDHCPIRSKPFRNDYGVLNIGLYTKSHCDCDADFYRCLREVRSRTADMLGNLYFNVMKLQCMREERLKVCRELKPIALGFERCIRYEDSPIKTVFKFTTPPVAY